MDMQIKSIMDIDTFHNMERKGIGFSSRPKSHLSASGKKERLTQLSIGHWISSYNMLNQDN